MAQFGAVQYRCTIGVGELVLVGPDGQRWAPAVCGPHRSVAITERASDEPAWEPEGFVSGCEGCIQQATDAADYAYTHHTV